MQLRKHCKIKKHLDVLGHHFFFKNNIFYVGIKEVTLLRRGERQDYCVLFSINVLNSSKPQKKKLKIKTNPPKETL